MAMAAKHEHGKGLEGGADLHVARKHLKALTKQGLGGKRGMLECILTSSV
jgi:hypothetical protein